MAAHRSFEECRLFIDNYLKSNNYRCIKINDTIVPIIYNLVKNDIIADIIDIIDKNDVSIIYNYYGLYKRRLRKS